MKNARQKQILSLINEYDIETQEDLIVKLKMCGFKCTQATVSRDIKDLHLIKVSGGYGRYKYAYPLASANGPTGAKFDKILTETVVSAEAAGNMVVIKTFTGMAMAAGAAIDALHWEGTLGTIAGDDTIFMVVRSPENAVWITKQLMAIVDERV